MRNEPDWGRINETRGSLLRLEIASDHPAFKALFDKMHESAQKNIRPEGVDATLLLRVDSYSFMLPFNLVKGWVPTNLDPGQGRAMSETNMFDGVTDIRELIGLAIGAGSVCWSNPGGAGEFDSTTAADIVDAAYGRVQMLIADSFSAEVAS